jgi:cobalamin biosynthesis protein CobT
MVYINVFISKEMSMKASTYMYEAKNVSGVMGRHSEVKVVFGGEDAKTDGNLITLPSVNENHEMSEVDVKVARGYVDHEAAHVRWTDNEAWKKLMDDRMDDPEISVFHSTLNALEDVRIEGKLLAQYSGSRDNLDAVADACGTELRDSMGGRLLSDLSAREVGALAATWYGRGRHSYGGVGAEMFGEIKPDVQKIVMQHVDQIDEHTSFDEVAKLAESMITCFDRHDEDINENEGGSMSKGETSASDESREDESEATRGDEIMTDEKAKEQVLKKATGADKAFDRAGYRRFSDAEDETLGHDRLEKDFDQFKHIQGQMVGQINVIRRKLERKLASKVQRGWHGGQTKGRLDSRRLVGAYTGSESVYKSRDIGDDLDVAVMIAVDHSGSMDGDRIVMAQKAVIALAEALEPTQVKLSVKGFKTKHVPSVWKKSWDPTKYSSISPVLVLEYKKFEQPLHRCREVIGGMLESWSNVGGIHNVDGVSVQMIGEELMKRPEKRKVLMVLSDGLPEDDEMDRMSLNNHLKKVVEDLEARGVEVFGVGIQTDAVKQFYRWHTVVRNTDDLEKELIDRMSNVLVGGGWDVRKAS